MKSLSTNIVMGIIILSDITFIITYFYPDEEDSGEDEDVLTRQNIKRQAQQLVDAKNRRKVAKRKKTKK